MQGNLSKEELADVKGGVVKLKLVGVGLVTGGIISFIIGAINGYLRPLTCSSSK